MAAEQKPCVMIATPTPGSVKTAYMKSVLATMTDLAKRGIACGFSTWEGSDIASQRNILASRFLRDSSFTHLFFVDSDMMLLGDLCARLLSLGKSVVGCIYPGKVLLAREIEQALKRGVSPKLAMLAGANWHFWRNASAAQLPEAPVCQVDSVPFGAVMIARDVLAAMVANGSAREDKAAELAGGPRWNFFGARAEDAAQGRHYQEDLAFCRRWKMDCGGELWAVLDAPIGHVGDFVYGQGGSLWDLVQAVKAASRAKSD